MSKKFDYQNDDYDKYANCRDAYKNGEMSSRQAAACCNMSQSAFWSRVQKDEECEDGLVFVTQLYALRQQIGISAEKLAKLSGINRSTIHAYEARTRSPSRAATIAICEVLGADSLTTDLCELVEIPRHFLRKNARTFPINED